MKRGFYTSMVRQNNNPFSDVIPIHLSPKNSNKFDLEGKSCKILNVLELNFRHQTLVHGTRFYSPKVPEYTDPWGLDLDDTGANWEHQIDDCYW